MSDIFLLSPERCRSLFSGSCIVLYCRSLSSMAQPLNEGLTLETSALETLHAYGGQFTLSTQFIKPNFQFNSTLNRYIDLKSFVTCLFVSYDLFLINSLFKFSIDLKILRRAFFQAGLTRRRTFRAVTHSEPHYCLRGRNTIFRPKKKTTSSGKGKNITDFHRPYFVSHLLSGNTNHRQLNRAFVS